MEGKELALKEVQVILTEVAVEVQAAQALLQLAVQPEVVVPGAQRQVILARQTDTTQAEEEGTGILVLQALEAPEVVEPEENTMENLQSMALRIPEVAVVVRVDVQVAVKVLAVVAVVSLF